MIEVCTKCTRATSRWCARRQVRKGFVSGIGHAVAKCVFTNTDKMMDEIKEWMERKIS